jgi:hypothetical protein
MYSTVALNFMLVDQIILSSSTFDAYNTKAQII